MFKLPIVLIGPMTSGKSTIAEKLAKKLNLPDYPLDYMRGYYYLKARIDLAHENKLRDSGDFKTLVDYWKPYEVDCVEKAIEEFQEIYRNTFGKELSFAEASEQASQLFRFYKSVLENPLTNKHPKESTHE